MRYALPLLAFLACPAFADSPVVEGAVATPSANGWTFSVTVRHADTGWDHYADGWSVHAPDGTELGYRKLHHPHETEQPFTRSLGGVEIPDGIETVVIRAHDNVHGWGKDLVLELPDG
ncbi:hypothetical protein JANAI62_04630 [Jannaschia pagri]|uniref:Uncharacterized protein n=1 Tax=Jannaschia pagri TaxID=2829797 RepID=A0ABQ4NI27_9RHOB|nr:MULTISPECIES: hypothetical protein [unclassified Jannaschia]GIT90054.1 hypothetical protein JANAI61_05120 [Jannaschia sp. AI_61]GIT93840.1 hypothetical protein JANAI62_04630 [Jannaschia sp. AI_62]